MSEVYILIAVLILKLYEYLIEKERLKHTRVSAINGQDFELKRLELQKPEPNYEQTNAVGFDLSVSSEYED